MQGLSGSLNPQPGDVLQNPYRNWFSIPYKTNKQTTNRKIIICDIINRDFLRCRLKNKMRLLGKVFPLSQKMLPEMFNLPSHICDARKPGGKKTCSAFHVGDSRKDTEEPQRKALLRPRYGMDRLHTYPWNPHQPQHPLQLFVHCFVDAKAEYEPAATSSTCPKLPSFPPGSCKAFVVNGSSAAYGEEGSFFFCCQTPLPSHGNNLRQRPVGDPVVTFHDPSRAVTKPTAKATEGTMDRQPTFSSTQPSSQSTQLSGIHLLDIPWGHLLCPTDRFGIRNQPSAPVLYWPKSASTQTESRINVPLPSALKHELPISNNLMLQDASEPLNPTLALEKCKLWEEKEKL